MVRLLMEYNIGRMSHDLFEIDEELTAGGSLKDG
jgi:hypothetical protein